MLSWNVRGANDVNKRRIIKSVVRKQKVDLFCIQETKIQLMTDGVVKSLGVGRFLDWRTIEAVVAAGGVLICWDKRSLELLEWEEGQFSISCKFRTVENGVVWVFTGVYGPFTKEDRECLWDEFGAIRGLWGEPWCVGGDFNVILSLRGKKQAREDYISYEEVCSGYGWPWAYWPSPSRWLFYVEWGASKSSLSQVG